MGLALSQSLQVLEKRVRAYALLNYLSRPRTNLGEVSIWWERQSVWRVAVGDLLARKTIWRPQNFCALHHFLHGISHLCRKCVIFHGEHFCSGWVPDSSFIGDTCAGTLWIGLEITNTVMIVPVHFAVISSPDAPTPLVRHPSILFFSK